MPTACATTLPLRDPTDVPPTRQTFVDAWWRLDDSTGGDEVWSSCSTRSWFPDVLPALCRPTGSDHPAALWAFEPFVLTTPDPHRAGDALDTIAARPRGPETAAAATAHTSAARSAAAGGSASQRR